MSDTELDLTVRLLGFCAGSQLPQIISRYS
jgi:hypothetical protein